MLQEDGVKNFASFEGTAVIPFFFSWVILLIFASLCLYVLGLVLNQPSFLVLLISPILLLLIYLYSREFFKSFLFELRSDFFFSRKGVITPSYTIIPYENIQDVHLEQSIIEKILGLWRVKIYTATFSDRGSDMIQGLSVSNVEAFKNALFTKIKEVKKVVD